MEWLQHALWYTPLERELLDQDPHPFFSSGRGRSFIIDGAHVFVVRADPHLNDEPAAVPAVFVHGMGGNMQFFGDLASSLQGKRDLVLIDLPGHGHAPDGTRRDDFSPQGIVELVHRIIEEMCGADSEFILIGHSYGTTHSLRLASKPELKQRCRGIVCITPPYGAMPLDFFRTIAKYIPSFLFDTLFRARDRRGGLYSHSVSRLVSPKASEGARRQQLRANLLSRTSTALCTLSESKIYDLSDEDDRSSLPECPILLIHAADDKLCPPNRAIRLHEEMRALGKANTLVTGVSDAGHAVLFEQPEKLQEIVAEFLNTHIDGVEDVPR